MEGTRILLACESSQNIPRPGSIQEQLESSCERSPLLTIVAVVAVVALVVVFMSPRRQYVACKHARRYEQRVSAMPALISGKPPQICPANSGSLSLIVVKKGGPPYLGTRTEKWGGKKCRVCFWHRVCRLFYKRSAIFYILNQDNDIVRRQHFYALPNTLISLYT